MSDPVQAQTTIAHWSFDAADLTTAGDNITGVGDDTGNHNATIGNGTFSVSADSVVGRFGEALRFNGVTPNSLSYPILAELAESGGNPSYTVSMWVNWPSATVPTSGPFSTLSNWGEGGAGTDGETARFTYAFGPVGTSAMRGQTRYAATANGTDIYAHTQTVPGTINDGSWHMLTWTFDVSTGMLTDYFDGAFVDTFQSTASSFLLADSTSTVGSIGFKADNGLYLNPDTRLDDIWVFDGVLDEEGVGNLYDCNDYTGTVCPLTTLRATVNTTNGNVVIDNGTDAGITFNSYLLGSQLSSLDDGGWNPISNQSISGFPAGSGDGDGWEAGGGPNPTQLAEYRLIGDSTLDPAGTIDLGNAYDELVDAQDLVFQYTLHTGDLVKGRVVYVESVGLPGDYNGNDVVDAADYAVWRDALEAGSDTLTNRDPLKTNGSDLVSESDFLFWRMHFGETLGSGSGAAAAAAVPEPSTAWLVALGAALCVCWMKRDHS